MMTSFLGSNWVIAAVTWICEQSIDSVGCEDSIEVSIIQTHPAVPEICPCTSTHSSAAIPVEATCAKMVNLS